jgi:hypothetical protein
MRWYTGREGRAGGGAEWIGSRGLVRTYLLQVTRREAASEAGTQQSPEEHTLSTERGTP